MSGVSDTLYPHLVRVLKDITAFSAAFHGLRLRRYQRQAAQAVIDSVLRGKGLSLVVMFPRQSGKNELQAQIEAYLLTVLSRQPAEIVKISPTWKPQSLNAMRRLERVLEINPLLAGRWMKESGYIYRVGQARITFLSGGPEAHIVGATASTLLEVDEAQDVLTAKFDKDIAPMAASTNATRVFWGTAWTSQTLLARELRAAREAEQRDGQRRAFVLNADQVAAEVPPYAAFVAGQVTRLGRSHPMVRTQFFSEEIEAAGAMFPAERRAGMQGSHLPLAAPRPGYRYALLLDVAGADEAVRAGEDALANPGRDSTALTVVELDRLDGADDLPAQTVFRMVQRRQWTGTPHPQLYAEIRRLAEFWQAARLVVDATGVGAGLAGWLERALPGRVQPFTFNSASKSRLGWDFIALVEGGRYLEPRIPAEMAEDEQARLAALFWRQAAACEMEVLPGPERRLCWGVPETRRDPESGGLLHDDLLLSAALCAALEETPPAAGTPAAVIRAADPLRELDKGF